MQRPRFWRNQVLYHQFIYWLSLYAAMMRINSLRRPVPVN